MAHCLGSKRACSLAHLHQGQHHAAHCAAPVAAVLRPVPTAACRDSWLLGSAQHEHHHGQRRTRPALVMCSSPDAAAAAAASNAAAGEVPSENGAAQQREHCVVNFYHLVDLPDPHQMLARHRSAIGERDIRGRIYISGQGINAQFGGPKDEALEYTRWVAEQPEFQGLRYSVWPAPGPMFPKLRLKYRPSLISLAGGMAALPITDPAQRATPLEPAQWKEMIRDAKSQGVVVLDVRNSYEWDAGHFAGAVRPDEEVFNETPVGEGEGDLPAPLKDADKDAPIMMYCTGGIRCDVYSAFLKRKGFSKMYTLHGGIQNYLVQEGGQHWNGSLFVFDGRMALSAEDPLAADPTSAPLRAAVPCQLCGAPEPTLPHMNCANIDCNELFIACDACKTRFTGCCCEECTRAPRLLRPVKLDGGHYGSWGNYADGDSDGDDAAQRISLGRSREGRVARRARRREACRQRREAHEQQQQAKKQAVREAMARLYEAEAAQQQQQQQEEGGLSELQRRLLARRQQQQQQQETAAAR